MVTYDAPRMRPPSNSPQDGAHPYSQSPSTQNYASRPLRQSSSTRTRPPAREPEIVTFDALSAEWRLHRLLERRTEALEIQQRRLERALALTGRVSRTLTHVQIGLVEILKNGDKRGFSQTLGVVEDLRRARGSFVRPYETLEDRSGQAKDLASLSFLHKISDDHRADLIDFVNLLRTSPSFLAERIKRLDRNQLQSLASFPSKLKVPARDPFLSSMGRGFKRELQDKQNAAFTKTLVDTAREMERTTALSLLLFNLYSAASEPDDGDYLLRLNTWSSVCADLYSHSDERYQPLLIENINSFASLHEWRAKPRIELFLMNILQTGAFLLDNAEDSFRYKDAYPFPGSDPLQTRDAEDFYDTAVREVFAILDDRDAGLPFGALHFASAVLGKIRNVNVQTSFRGFLLLNWYFSDYLFSAIRMPEAHGMLLRYHVSDDAREKILKEVAMRVQVKFAEFLGPTFGHPPTEPDLREGFQRMADSLVPIGITAPKHDTSGNHSPHLRPTALVLSISEIMTIIDMLVPQTPSAQTPFEPFMSSSAFAFASLYNQRLPSLAKMYPLGIGDTANGTQKYQSTENSAAITLVRKFSLIQKELTVLMARKDLYPVPAHNLDLWTVLEFDEMGYPSLSQALESMEESMTPRHFIENPHTGEGSYPRLDPVQKAVLRLLQNNQVHNRTPRFNLGSDALVQEPLQLHYLFYMELEAAERNADGKNEHFWHFALQEFDVRHKGCILAKNDTRILKPILSISRERHKQTEERFRVLELRLRYLEENYEVLSDTIADTLTQLERVKEKMWYATEIRYSSEYGRARDVTRALQNMAFPVSSPSHSPAASLRGRRKPRSLAESIMSESENQTTFIMKASPDQGGPRKLADEQVKRTQDWLEKGKIENFCRGEERIHRFCEEIQTVAGNLVGNTGVLPPVLFSSEIFHFTRGSSDTRSMPGSSVTRPSSILNEDGPSSFLPLHSLRAMDGPSRHQPSDTQSSPGRKSSFSFGSDRLRHSRDSASGADTSSNADSPGRAVSSTNESMYSIGGSIFTNQPQSTSASSIPSSRPPSFINDMPSFKPAEHTIPRKSDFQEDLTQRLIGLLLSDLGSPVWTRGSETDAWLTEVLDHDSSLVLRQLPRRDGVANLLMEAESLGKRVMASTMGKSSQRAGRSMSVGPMHPRATEHRHSPLSWLSNGIQDGGLDDGQSDSNADDFNYHRAYEALMVRFSRQTDPVLKLAVLDDLISLVISSIHEARKRASNLARHHRLHHHTPPITSSPSTPTSRRSSWVPSSPGPQGPDGKKMKESKSGTPKDSPVEDEEVINQIKLILVKTRPKTLFRDLQFITAFVPADRLNHPPSRNPFHLVGIAALAFKEEVCGSMVAVAAKIMSNRPSQSQSLHFETPEHKLRYAAQMWIHAAKEGNPIAQRELAGLYLSNPEMLPAVSLPLVAPREIFRSDLKYTPGGDTDRPKTQAMCLALHWMQAASKKDLVAKERLGEREANIAIR